MSIGDPVRPGPRVIAYPQKLSTDSFPVLGYPLESVVASPPYGITAGLLGLLLAPGSRLTAADLVLQRAVVRKYAERRFRGYRLTQGAALPRRAFRPPPRVDSAVLVIRRQAR